MFKGDLMKDKTIFVVTVFEKYEPADHDNDNYSVCIGSNRSPCFKHTFKEAEEVVLNNIGDIWETCYDYAVIEEINCQIYPRHKTHKFYKYNREIGGYEAIEELEYLKRMTLGGIG